MRTYSKTIYGRTNSRYYARCIDGSEVIYPMSSHSGIVQFELCLGCDYYIYLSKRIAPSDDDPIIGQALSPMELQGCH